MSLHRKNRLETVSSFDNKFRFMAILILIPVIAAGTAIYYVVGNGLDVQLGNRGNDRLTTVGWQTAQATLAASQPQYAPQFSYYKLQEGQNLQWVAKHFSVSLTKLQQMNPGNVVWGTTIMVPPVEYPLTPIPTPQLTLKNLTVAQLQGITYVSNSFSNPEAYVTIPQLMTFLKSYGTITELSPKVYLVNQPLFIQDNIRVDITSATVNTLLLRSSPNFNITTLTFQNSEALIEGVNVSSYNPSTGQPDTNVNDGRSFLRAYQNARMDVINTNISYLGMTLKQSLEASVRQKDPYVVQGGVYGVSWRIGSGTYGQEIATGWVQNSTFEHNYIGAFTFGASGMMWQDNLFTANKVYGLDPHNNSNNATIEYNRFVANGKHGFIVSKECDYNTIKYNISIDNALHGFMLHDNSDYNIFEDNISIGNYDNFVIYDSNFNMTKNNLSYNPRGSGERINGGSTQNYIENNVFYGGKQGVYLYGTADGADVLANTFYLVGIPLITKGASRVVYTGNLSNVLNYQIGKQDRVVFGVNTTTSHPAVNLKPLQIIDNRSANHQTLIEAAGAALNVELKTNNISVSGL
jgi:hypothetical protein